MDAATAAAAINESSTTIPWSNPATATATATATPLAGQERPAPHGSPMIAAATAAAPQ